MPLHACLKFDGHAIEATEVRVVLFGTGPFTLHHDRVQRRHGSGQVGHRAQARQRCELHIDLQRRVADEQCGLALRFAEGLQAAAQRDVEIADRAVVLRARAEAAERGVAPVAGLRRVARAIGNGCVMRAFEKLEMCHGVARERLQANDEAGRVGPRLDRKHRPPEMRLAADRLHQVGNQGQVSHLFHGHADDHAAPARDCGGLVGAPARIRQLQAERGIEVAAHQVVLDLRRLVKGIEQLLSAGGG